MARRQPRPHPPMTVKDAATVATALRDYGAGRPMNRILLAEAMGRSPASSDFRGMITAANRYGLVNGNYNSESVELTKLGEQYTRPTSEEERLEAERTAIRRIPVFDQILLHFNNNKLPPSNFLKNTLEREPFSISPEWADEVASILTKNGKNAGLIRTVSDALWVTLDAGRPATDIEEAEAPPAESTSAESIPEEEAPAGEKTEATPAPPAETREPQETPRSSPAQRQFFIAHGRNRTPLDQLQKILKELDIPYVVAKDEPNLGRPISEKVGDLMKACSAGIFIFSADEVFQDKDGNDVIRPRENVVYELGAASLLFGRRIVILKEKGVTFPTDFRDLGYIEFEKDNLEAKSMELLRELVALKVVRILPGD